MVKNLPARQETQIRSQGQEDPLEKGVAAHSSILAWRIPWTEEPDGLQFMGLQRVGFHWATNIFKAYFMEDWFNSMLTDTKKKVIDKVGETELNNF